jgi:hypothetical protein
VNDDEDERKKVKTEGEDEIKDVDEKKVTIIKQEWEFVDKNQPLELWQPSEITGDEDGEFHKSITND